MVSILPLISSSPTSFSSSLGKRSNISHQNFHQHHLDVLKLFSSQARYRYLFIFSFSFFYSLISWIYYFTPVITDGSPRDSKSRQLSRILLCIFANLTRSMNIDRLSGFYYMTSTIKQWIKIKVYIVIFFQAKKKHLRFFPDKGKHLRKIYG